MIRDFVYIWKKNLQKYVKMFILVMVISMLCFNVGYAYLFRITWGSAFIAVDKTTDYLEQIRQPNAYVLYSCASAAREYFPLNKKSDNYAFKTDVIYEKAGSEEFSEDNLNALKGNHSEVYVLQRISAFGNSRFPEIDFSKYNNLKLVQVIDGNVDDIVDRVTGVLTKLIGKEYTYNRVYMYEVVEKE